MNNDIDRRKFLAATGSAAAVAALAGCAAQEEDYARTAATEVRKQATSDPPSPPGTTPDNEVWRYVLASLEWQNEQLAAQTRALQALAKGDSVD